MPERNTPKSAKPILAALGLGAVTGAWFFPTWRAKRLAAKYATFRANFQARHDAIDAGFNHQDRVVNGIRWHYVDEGSPDGEVILFLHGLPEGWYSWCYVLPEIDHTYRLIAIDMKGYGRSDLQDQNYNWHHVAAQIDDLMASLSIEKYYVISHDWGSIIGSVLVSDHREHILGFVRMEADLIQPRGRFGKLRAYIQKPQWLIFQNSWLATSIMRDPGWCIDFVYRSRRMVTDLQSDDRDYLVYEFSRPGVAEMNPQYFKGANWDLDTALGAICKNTFPFRVVQLQADSDPAQPRSMFANLSTQCSQVELEWITNASHFDNFDQPIQVAQAINRFVHSTMR